MDNEKSNNYMNKIYLFAVMLMLLCNIGIAKAQNNGDHLVPVGGIYDIFDFQFDYYSKVRKVLFDGLTDTPEIRFQIMPSFTPESVLVIDDDSIIYHICKQMLWINKNWKKVKINKFKAEIDRKSVELLKSLFDTAISQVRFPYEYEKGLDGVDYYFSIFELGYGTKSGKVWSPDKGSKMDKLVDIGNKLIELVKSSKEKVEIDNELQKEIETLIKELKQ